MKSTNEKISQLQLIEQNMQNILAQKQQFQKQLQEIESAKTEAKGKDAVYKIIGNIMVKSDPKKLDEELKSKKDLIKLRIQAIEKQEANTREKASKVQKEVMAEIKEEKK